MARTLDEWLDHYGVSHRNRINQAIHQIAVPLILLSVLALLVCLPIPQNWLVKPGLNWSSVLWLVALLFYLRLSPRYALLMALIGFIASALFHWAYWLLALPVMWGAAAVFAAAWVAQFIGHAIEGRRPSFFTDLQFLLIGPLWVIEEWRDLWFRHGRG